MGLRRSHIDVRLGRFITIGQTWQRHTDDTDWRVRQVHRADCQVELEAADGTRLLLAISTLRREFSWAAPRQEAMA